ncbi:MAG: cellulase family glycosylhydrolase [Leifsonia sp.]
MTITVRPRKLRSRLAILAAAAGVAAILTGPALPAQAATNQFRGVNWADTRDNYNSGWAIPDGLASGDSYSTIHSIADSYITAFKNNLGANTVRLPINPPGVNSVWWGRYKGAIDAALSDGMNVILSAWTESNTTGTITNMSDWNTMWNTVVNDYGSNSNVYFEPLNEPFGYSSSQWISICSSWLSAHSSVPRGRVIISGTGYNDNVTSVGAASALNGTLLSLHFYSTWASSTQESDWVSNLDGRIGAYQSRTIIDEFGGPMTTGINYLANHNGQLVQSYFAAVTDTARSTGMGTVVWAGLKTGDNYSMESHNGSSLSNNNSSAVTQVRWGWGL